MDKRLFWVSFFLHIFLILLVDFFSEDQRINKQFIAFGRHSKHLTHAYFRKLNSPKFNYQKYLSIRRKVEKERQAKLAKKKLAKKKMTKKKAKKIIKKIVKKAEQKKKVTKLVKKETKKNKPKVLSKPEEKKIIEKEKSETNKKVEKKEEVQEREEFEIEELYFNLLGEVDPKMFVYQQFIQQEVDRIWRPPLGVAKGIECVVNFEINKDGSIKSFKIQKSSKMLIYDLSIVCVAKQFNFDKCLWGKSFTINFRQ